MKFILVRHAQTTANTKSVILGGKEGGELSQRGLRQVKVLSARLSNEKFSEAYCSPANRARQTCDAVLACHDCKVTYCDELREIDMGELAGLSHEEADAKYPNILLDIFENPQQKIPGGESLIDVQTRVMPLIEKMAQKPGNPTILAVGHNVVNRVILSTLLGLPLDKCKNIKQKNACWALLDVKPGFAQIYTLDNSIHSTQ
ncbi:2,3-bisphosphoglycerate-dependent phosphoglycerate mutase [uncultured archaeon]|nr:2,3-bisphosphoglycerate-dependent phosphoglycerate mutase [uncultured archaeon]